jgi:hypothetical protein
MLWTAIGCPDPMVIEPTRTLRVGFRWICIGISWDLGDLLIVYRTGSKPPTAVEKAGKTGLEAGLFGLASPKLVTDEFSRFSKLGDGINNIIAL